MANYKAVANGNWSALATWQDDSTGSYVASTVLPGASDVVYFNNFTVQMDVDVTVLEIRNDSATGVTQGGAGVISTSRTVNADLYHRISLIAITATSPDVVNITGNMPGTAGPTYNVIGLSISGNCTVNYVGDVRSSTNNSAAIRAINVGAGATLNLTGDVYAGGVNAPVGNFNSSDGIRLDSNSTLNIVGNVYGGFQNAGNSGVRLIGTNQTISITGNLNGLGSTSISAPNPAVLLNSTAVFSITGNLTAGQNAPALYGPTATTEVQVFGNVQNASNGYMATIAPYVYLDAAVTQWEFRKSNLNTNTLYTPGVATGHPAEANVRTGTVYGPTNNLTGTCAVPPSGSVALGVPVDNTVGTAYVDATSLANALTGSLAAPLATSLFTEISGSSDPLAERMRNQSTVQTTGAQLAGLL